MIEYRPDIPTHSHHQWPPDSILPVDADPVLCVVAPPVPDMSKAITPFKLYRVRKDTGKAFEIIGNNDDPLYCLWFRCCFLNRAFALCDPPTASWQRVYISQADLPEHLR